jgi:hypothetical protein
MASHLIRTGAVAARSLKTVSHVTDGAPEADERRFIREVEHYCGWPSIHVNSDDYDFLSTSSWVVPRGIRPIYCDIERRMQEQRARVLLSGRVGDGVMGNFPDDAWALRDGLRWWNVRRLLTLAHRESRASKVPIVVVLGRVMESLLPEQRRQVLDARRQLARQACPERPRTLRIETVYGLQQAFVRRNDLESSRSGTTTANGLNGTNRRLIQAVTGYAVGRNLQTPNSTPHVVFSYPYADRQLVEFALSIPPGVLRPIGEPRALMRRAFSPFVPARILQRFSKSYAPPFMARALRPIARDFLRRFDNLHVVAAGCVDPQHLKGRLTGVVDGSLTNLGNLPNIAAVELWFEARAGRFEPFASATNERR